MDIEVKTKAEAEDILKELRGIIDRYGDVSVEELYDLITVVSSFTDSTQGWRDLRQATIKEGPEGYTISLPQPGSISDNQEK